MIAVYHLTNQLPSEERYVAAAQIRRAAWSVHNNIAEGNAKRGPSELRRYFDCALGSLAEVDAMVATLSDIYPVDSHTVGRIGALRRTINAQLFSILRANAR